MAFVQSKNSGSSSAVFTSANAAGNCLVIALQTWGTPGTVSDTRGNTYTQIVSQANNDVTGGNDDYTTVWIAPNCLIGPNTVSISGTNVIILIIAEYSAVYTAAPLDVYSATTGASPTVSVVTGIWSDLLLMVAGRATGTLPGNNFAQTGSYTLREDVQLGSGGTPRELALWDSFATNTGTYSNTISLPLGGAGANIAGILIGLKASLAPVEQRGNIDYDQVRISAREGNGQKFQMFGGSAITAGHVAVYDAAGNVVDGGSAPGGGGSVTSVALTVPAEFSVAGSPVTTSGTLAISKATEAANTVWAGPSSGAAAVPTFRALSAADLPAGITPAFLRETPAGTLDGTNVHFALSFAPNPGASLFLFLNGVAQVPTTDYAISSTTITYVTAPDAVDLMIAQYTH